MPVVVSTGFSAPLQERLQRAVPCPFLEPINSVGVKVGYLARQTADIYINHHPVNFWDTCGPLAILEEAGGVMTQWDGAPLAYELAGPHRHPAPTVASNGARHKELLALLNAR
jgi:3'-phosphoadenosine 5'-phosphosulfate (PAPS) 3'-phosphatase